MAGQYYDTETGLHYNYFHYYEPKLGIFLAADPIGQIAGINLYAYVNNNPLLYVDPFGLEPYQSPPAPPLPIPSFPSGGELQDTDVASPWHSDPDNPNPEPPIIFDNEGNIILIPSTRTTITCKINCPDGTIKEFEIELDISADRDINEQFDEVEEEIDARDLGLECGR